MRHTLCRLLFPGALAVLASACGASPGADAKHPLQSSLRALASGAPPGERAYWLGPEFHGAPVQFANPTGGRYAILIYGRRDVAVDIAVESLRPGVAGRAAGFVVRVRRAGGQPVLLVFHSPRRPSAALIRAAEAALEPIPVLVTYPG